MRRDSDELEAHRAFVKDRPNEILGRVARRLRRATERLERRMAELRRIEAPSDLATEVNPSMTENPGEESEPPVERTLTSESYSREESDLPRSVALGQIALARPRSTLDPMKPRDGAEFPDERTRASLRKSSGPLFIALLLGAEEQDCSLIHRLFLEEREPKHQVNMYRWQGDLTLDQIGFDAIDPDAGRADGQPDLLIISDRLAGPLSCAAASRTLQEAALRARLLFPRVYLVALYSGGSGADPSNHPFSQLEEKTRLHDLPLFDDHLIGEVTPQRISRLLTSRVLFCRAR